MDIDNLIKEATLEKNSSKKEAYRAIKAAILLNNSSKNPKPNGKMININKGTDTITLSELEISIIKKEIQVREEQISMYDANSRKDLADMYREQMKYLKELLPPEISNHFCHQTVQFGRDICRARAPKCTECPLNYFCKYYSKIK